MCCEPQGLRSGAYDEIYMVSSTCKLLITLFSVLLPSLAHSTAGDFSEEESDFSDSSAHDSSGAAEADSEDEDDEFDDATEDTFDEVCSCFWVYTDACVLSVTRFLPIMQHGQWLAPHP